MGHSITIRALALGLILTMLSTGLFARPPGRMVDIGGRQLHVVETVGADPLVVLEAGGGAFSSFSSKLQTTIRDELGLRVLSYDRAGLGWSDAETTPYRVDDKADDLAALLTALHVDAPVILVASSYGGWVAKAFGARHPEMLRALVLVDPNSAHFFAHYPDRVEKIEADGAHRKVCGFRRFGLRLQQNWLAKQVGSSRSAFDPILTERHQFALGQMLIAFGETSALMAELKLPDVPTILISRGRPQKGFPWGGAALEASWREGHEQLIEHLSIKQHWIAERSTHAVIFEQPDIVIDALTALVEQTH